MPEARLGTFDELLEITREPMRLVAKRLRAVIRKIHPGHVEVVRLGDRAATYGLGPKKMSEGYTYILPHNEWVNLGFYKGTDLPDPEGLLEGTGARMRHVKIRTTKEAEQPAVRALVKAALAERKKALGR
jgi:hypothetical protein